MPHLNAVPKVASKSKLGMIPTQPPIMALDTMITGDSHRIGMRPRWPGLLLVLVLVLLAPALPSDASEPSRHWAFQPLGKLTPPGPPAASRSASHSSSSQMIDGFIQRELSRTGLSPAEPAAPEALIRRITLDLIGLPPTPEEVQAFVADPTPASYDQLIERLLASPHYGERWARHWLDLARYAESDGFEHDAVRPHSWRFRDYVVRSFNQDKPFDRFLREQIAGDELWPGDPEALIATGFNLLGPDMVDSADQTQRRVNVLNDMTDTAAAVFLGLTLGCARCHDHKFEPFTQQDYFSLQAFFAPAEPHREHPVPTAEERARHQAATAAYERQAREELRSIEHLESSYRQKLFEAKLARLSEDAQVAHRTPKARRTVEQEGTVQETAPQVHVTESEIKEALSPEDRRRRDELETRLKRFSKPGKLPSAMVLQTASNSAVSTRVLARGDYNSPLEEVTPRPPLVLMGRNGKKTASATPPKRSIGSSPPESLLGNPGGRRAALADWLVSPENPLTARVFVNRLWQHHFGRGLVATPNDFGTRGSSPSHPELLDWLAGEFIRGGWSIKHLQRLILRSAVYQQSTRANERALAMDPENRLLSRFPRIRLEGEVIRDSLLAVSGRLNRQVGGPAVAPPIPSEIVKVAKNWQVSPNPADHERRSLYIQARRNLRFPFLEVFDAPDTNLSCPERGRSTTALQSLTLLNSAQIIAAAQATAARLTREEPDERARVERLYQVVLSRRPTDREQELSQSFLLTAPLAELCRVLLNLNEFVYVP